MGRYFTLNVVNGAALALALVAYLLPMWAGYHIRLAKEGGELETVLSLGVNLVQTNWTLLSKDDTVLFADVQPDKVSQAREELIFSLNDRYFTEEVQSDGVRLGVQIMAGVTCACLLAAFALTSCVEKIKWSRWAALSAMVASIVVWALWLGVEMFDVAAEVCEGPGRTNPLQPGTMTCSAAGKTFDNQFIVKGVLRFEQSLKGTWVCFFLGVCVTALSALSFFLTFTRFKSLDEYESSKATKESGDGESYYM